MSLTKEKICPSCGFCVSLVSEHTKRIATIVEQKLLAELAEAKAQVAAANKLIEKWDYRAATSVVRRDRRTFKECATKLRAALKSEGKAAHAQSPEI